MGKFERNKEYDFEYRHCIYSGISKQIEFETKYGTEDKRKELEYIVNRYCEEEILSGLYLQKQLEEYISVLNERMNKNEQKNDCTD